MIGITEAQLAEWLSPIFWPFLRVLALFSVAPVFSIRAIPVRTRIGLAFFIALCAQATLTGQPVVSVNSPQALGAVAQNVGVGIAIGFAVRLVFAAVEFAGELVGLQMGLNFASFFDPSSNSQVSAVSKLFGNMATLLFVVVNGHLTVLMAVVRSFDAFPADGQVLASLNTLQLHTLGALLFESALWIALPMIGLLLFVNLALGVMSRVAPQMNLFAVGFPITLTVGMAGIAATLPMLDHPMGALMQRMLDMFGR
jgi:flagellar biosynthetic protein FliR